MGRKIMLLAACAVLAACAKPGGKTAQADYDVTVPLKDVMEHAMDMAAWPYWDRSGDYVDAKGTHSRVPADPAKAANPEARDAAQHEWDLAESGAIQLVLMSNTLKLPGYVRVLEKDDNGDWVKFADRLNTAAHDSLDAVQAHDGDKMFSTGGEVYQVCTDCHHKYMLPFIDPKTGEIPDGVTPGGEPTKDRKNVKARSAAH